MRRARILPVLGAPAPGVAPAGCAGVAWPGGVRGAARATDLRCSCGAVAAAATTRWELRAMVEALGVRGVRGEAAATAGAPLDRSTASCFR